MEKLKINPAIGDTIRQARLQLGLNQREFAARVGVSQGLVGSWENHTKTPGASKLKRIADETGVSMDAILGAGPVVSKSLKISDEEEIRLIVSFRRLPRLGKKNAVDLVEMSANVGRVQQKKRSPTKVE